MVQQTSTHLSFSTCSSMIHPSCGANSRRTSWAILLDPTSACNLHCTGCWAAEYGNRLNLSLETFDFQNDAAYVHGCIAGGRNYLHINAKGDMEPCVFIHYSDCSIHDTSLLDALRSPLFMAYHDNQPFNDNILRPCPMLENPEVLRAMVKATGAVNTDYESPETVDHLCDKTTPYAENWKGAADKLWRETCAKCGKSV